MSLPAQSLIFVMTALIFVMTDRPWSDDEETARESTLDAGLTPKLYRCWMSTPTAHLVDAGEFIDRYGEDDDGLRARLTAEIAYRLKGC